MARRIDDPKRARALARTIASDIALYNDEKLAREPRGPKLLKLLRREIEEGRQYFKQRVAADLAADELYDRAIEEVLARRSSRARSSSELDKVE